MQLHYVKVICDVHCDWDQQPPRYRVFVNNELFTERTWIWKDVYLEEALQLSVPQGTYMIRYELVEPELGKLVVKNCRVAQGPAQFVNEYQMEVSE